VDLDHHLVGADIRLKIAFIKKNETSMTKRCDLQEFDNPRVKNASNVKLGTRFNILSNAENQEPIDMNATLEVIEKIYDEISDKLL
jgi:hypothetical protein